MVVKLYFKDEVPYVLFLIKIWL